MPRRRHITLTLPAFRPTPNHLGADDRRMGDQDGIRTTPPRPIRILRRAARDRGGNLRAMGGAGARGGFPACRTRPRSLGGSASRRDDVAVTGCLPDGVGASGRLAERGGSVLPVSARFSGQGTRPGGSTRSRRHLWRRPKRYRRDDPSATARLRAERWRGFPCASGKNANKGCKVGGLPANDKIYTAY